NHVVIELTDEKKAVKFYADVFGLKMLRGGEGAAWCKLGEHQFMAIFEVEKLQPDRIKHFGLMVRDAEQIKEVRRKLTKKYKLKLHPDLRCDFRDPWAIGSKSATCLTSRWSGSFLIRKSRRLGLALKNERLS